MVAGPLTYGTGVEIFSENENEYVNVPPPKTDFDQRKKRRIFFFQNTSFETVRASRPLGSADMLIEKFTARGGFYPLTLAGLNLI